MVALYIIGAVIALLIFILSLSIRITVEYGETVSLKVGTLFYNYKIIPSSKKKKTKKKKPKKDKKELKKEETGKKSIFKEFTEDMDIPDFIEILIKLLTRLSEMFKKHLKVRFKRFVITVSSESPDKAAILFGTITTAATWLFEYLTLNTKLYPLEKSEVAVRCDFEEKTMRSDVAIVIRIRVVHLLTYVVGAFFDFMQIKESKNKNKTSLKGNQKNER